MSRKSSPETPNKTSPSREDRLKSALKANMARRKAQAKARAQTEDRANEDRANKE